MPHGLPRRIKLAFVGQALVATLVISLGLLLGGLGVRQSLLHSLLTREAAAFEDGRRRDPAHPLPCGDSLLAYYDPRGAAPSAPLPLRRMSPGLHTFTPDGRAVYVAPQAAGTLYLSYRPTLVNEAVALTASIALLLALVAVYLVTWLTYRNSKRLVVPVAWLAQVVGGWDPRAPDAKALAPEHLPPDAGVEVHGLARALRALARRVGEFVQRERDFTRDASHELRTPLTVIRVATDLMLAEPELPPRQQRSLGRVQRAARDMEGVIEAFLVLAREAEVEPQSLRLPVRAIVEEEIAKARPMLRDKPIDLVLVDEGAPTVVAPANVLNVMLGNLLSNATRYTDRGRIEVRMHPDRIEVSDTGIGMSPEVLARAFDPFFRVDMERAEGKGIGLSIVRRLGERFDWPVSLESRPGEGTTAIIRFPATG